MSDNFHTHWLCQFNIQPIDNSFLFFLSSQILVACQSRVTMQMCGAWPLGLLSVFQDGSLHRLIATTLLWFLMPTRRVKKRLIPLSTEKTPFFLWWIWCRNYEGNYEGYYEGKHWTLSCEDFSWAMMLGAGRTHQTGPWHCWQVAL